MVGRSGLVVALDLDMRHPRLEHLHGGLEAGRHIHFENGRAIHVGVGFDGADQVEDAGGGVERASPRSARRAGSGQRTGGEMQVSLAPSRLRNSSRSATVTPCSANCGATSQGLAQPSCDEPGADDLLAGDERQRHSPAGGWPGVARTAEYALLPRPATPAICSSLRHRFTSLKRFWRLAISASVPGLRRRAARRRRDC